MSTNRTRQTPSSQPYIFAQTLSREEEHTATMSDKTSTMEAALPEKGVNDVLYVQAADTETTEGHHETIALSNNVLYRWAAYLEKLAGAESRGIERVSELMRPGKVTADDYIQMALIWFSTNLTANNILLGLLGPLTFELGLNDCLLLGTFGALTGSAGASYISTFGPQSGNRTMVSITDLSIIYAHPLLSYR